MGLRLTLTEAGAMSTSPSARYGLRRFARLGTAMLLAIAALKTASPDPERLRPIERQPKYSTWIPGPYAGRYYVLDPVAGTLILIGVGAGASAMPMVSGRKKTPATSQPD